jgi:peroxiredoxin
MRVVTAFGRGQAAPELELPSPEGRPISLREFLGRDVVLGFYC